MNIRTLLLVSALSILLSACGGSDWSQKTSPVKSVEVESGRDSTRSVKPAIDPGEAQIAAYRAPAPRKVARPQPARAVAVLIRRAQDQQRAGDFAAATVSLERALRIDPRSARLWNHLAQVRAAQRKYPLVTQLAAKSNALASTDQQRLRSDNWWLIANARRAMGDNSGARQAERQANSLQ